MQVASFCLKKQTDTTDRRIIKHPIEYSCCSYVIQTKIPQSPPCSPPARLSIWIYIHTCVYTHTYIQNKFVINKINAYKWKQVVSTSHFKMYSTTQKVGISWKGCCIPPCLNFCEPTQDRLFQGSGPFCRCHGLLGQLEFDSLKLQNWRFPQCVCMFFFFFISI